MPGSLRNGELIEVDGLTVRKWMSRVTFFKEDLSTQGKTISFLRESVRIRYSKKRCARFQVSMWIFFYHLGMIIRCSKDDVYIFLPILKRILALGRPSQHPL